MKEKTFIGASIIAAIVASFCCILPIVFTLTGMTVIGASALFASWRPYLLAATLGLLALGFYFVYRRSAAQCGPGRVCTKVQAGRSGRLLLWLATAAVIGFAAFPYYSGPVAEFVLKERSAKAASSPGASSISEHASFAIEGMDCAACAAAIEKRLKALPGVRQAAVSYESGKAEVDYQPGVVLISALKKAIEEAGYRSREIEKGAFRQ